ncbi:MAG: tagatose 1,6-diphosphate aldolase [Rhabdaerophilum sp.]
MKALSAGKLRGLRRMADTAGRFKMTAVDQRPPIINPIAAAHGGTAPWEAVARFKTLLVERLQGQSTAMLLDPNYAYPMAEPVLDPQKGLIMTLEDSAFRETGEGRLSAEIDGWSVAKIRRMGADAVKVLAWYRPDAPAEINAHQQDFTRRIGEACKRHDIPFLFELLVYPLPGEKNQTTQYIEMADKKSALVLESVAEFAKPEYGVDVFKLESPVPARDCDGSAPVQALFDEMGRLCGRPWVMLSAGAGMTEFKAVLDHAYRAGASGYLAGRAIWSEAFKAYPDWAAIEAGLAGRAVAYMRDINTLTDAKALPWWSSWGGATLADADESFRHRYSEPGS